MCAYACKGPQQGIFGLPTCLGEKGICEEVKKLLDIGAYVPLVQNRLVQAQYWHDPRAAAAYEKYNVFLPGINNEGAVKNETYKERLTKINKMVLVKFLNDTIVVPSDRWNVQQRGREGWREREREREGEREREREREGERGRERARESERVREGEREKERERKREKENERECERKKERASERE